MKNTTKTLATLAAMLFACMMVNATSAQAYISATGYLINYPGGGVKCATPEGNSTANGTALTFWDCTGSDIQKWYVEDGFIRNLSSGKCVTPRGNAYATNGAVLTLWDCGSYRNAAQTFSVGDRVDLRTNTFTTYGNKCITGYGNGTSNGTYMTLWSCASNVPATQNWGMYY
ncbi:ricin-type beta-trefoil lectin domain protein [Streptomyces sp. So13.3]|uniref:RICIN domain-containing protein n=1 Tax=Streptomyces TaxID=1883 RepID=UPI00164E9717|nr:MULTISPECIES: RICIN domain-containing protein [Streptomyces]MCZ4101626.1 RICIN domain-containing protein [Streptomyces sp. H39-C1]QNA76436.1 ricin-type beta-trefoil lectin domain protein [Streptomyces sp. So13.3]